MPDIYLVAVYLTDVRGKSLWLEKAPYSPVKAETGLKDTLDDLVSPWLLLALCTYRV